MVEYREHVEEIDLMSIDALLAGIQAQVLTRAIRITDHAREEMEDEIIILSEVLEAINTGEIIEITQIISVDLVA